MATEISAQPLDANNMANKRTDWAAVRTRLAADRTLMAAIRTSLSLIGFGFTIYTFFGTLRKAMGDNGPVHDYSPRRMGLTLVSLGIFVMVAFAVQHWLFLRKLEQAWDRRFKWSVALTAAGALAFIGVVVFVNILLHK